MMKKMRRHLMMMTGKRLPSEYRIVEYIKTKDFGGQYINTNLFADEFYIKTSAALINDNVIRYMFCNIGVNTYNKCFGQYQGKVAGNSSLNFSTTPFITRFKSDGTKIFDFYYNGEPQEDISTYSIDNDKKICIFGNDVATTRYMRGCQLYFAKLYLNGHLVSDLVPCVRISDDVAGLYDLVRDVFLTNSGTGDFIIP